MNINRPNYDFKLIHGGKAIRKFQQYPLNRNDKLTFTNCKAYTKKGQTNMETITKNIIPCTM
jgi:hypothetical protein